MQDKIDPLDLAIGARIRESRKKKGKGLKYLALSLGCSYQQVQKYENGLSRISVSTLLNIANALGDDITQYLGNIKKDISTHNISEPIKDIIEENEDPLNVLLVEDSPTDELLTRKALEDVEYPTKVLCLRDGDQAMCFLKKRIEINFPPPDLIILDLNIPLKKGIDVLKDIKRDVTLQDIPVVILTNSKMIKEMNEVYKNNAAGFICKSFDFEKFKEKVANLIEYWARTVVLPKRS